MRLKTDTLTKLISFLLGVAWAVVLVGSISSFFSFLDANFFIAILSAIVGAVPGLFMVLFLEYFLSRLEGLEELKKQTELLKKMLPK